MKLKKLMANKLEVEGEVDEVEEVGKRTRTRKKGDDEEDQKEDEDREENKVKIRVEERRGGRRQGTQKRRHVLKGGEGEGGKMPCLVTDEYSRFPFYC